MTLKYRVRNESGDFVYRQSIDKAVKNAASQGSIVEMGDKYGWETIGVAYQDVFLDSRKAVDAFVLWKNEWQRSWRDQEFGFENIVEVGEVEFPRKKCGLDNLLQTAKQTKAIRKGPRWDESFKNGVYHYVVTDYGRELAEFIRNVFLTPP